MAILTVTLPDETYDRLAAWAASRNQSVEEAVRPLLDVIAMPAEPMLPPVSDEERRATREAWLRDDAEALAARLPLGHVIDDDRESIYREREDAQL